MGTTSKAKGLGHALFGVGTTMVILGIALALCGSVSTGTLSIGIGVVLYVVAALRLKHLTIW
jgi:hypothetical protein